jgi:hypothetical protein
VVLKCDGSDKAKVIYQFSGEPEKIYESKITPIDVIISQSSDPNKPVGASDGWNWYRAWSGEPCAVEGTGYMNLSDTNPNSIWTAQIYTGQDVNGGTGVRHYKNGSLYQTFVPWYNQCSLLFQEFRFYPVLATLTVKDKTGKILYQDSGQSLKYEVVCGDDCPEGSHKCTHDKYPGYCCVPCKEVGEKLKNIASKVGR